MKNAVEIQQDYYRQTARGYHDKHVREDDEQMFALAWMNSLIEYYGIRSVLDVGAGTGRTLLWLKDRFPDLIIKGVEPVDALREEGYKLGLSRDELVGGDGNKLNFKDGAFDLVCEFGVLHHVPAPQNMVGEMLRVAKKGIFISDCNNFGQGGFLSRTLKQILNIFGLWGAYNFIRTKGKVYQISEGDGLFYSYSVYNNYRQIRNVCKAVHIMNSADSASRNAYAGASHVALFGLKK